MWDIVQNIVIFSVAMTIARFVIKSIFKLLLIGVVIALGIYGLNYIGLF
ncbi:hypothetical protein [Staphylococcus equorum]